MKDIVKVNCVKINIIKVKNKMFTIIFAAFIIIKVLHVYQLDRQINSPEI